MSGRSGGRGFGCWHQVLLFGLCWLVVNEAARVITVGKDGRSNFHTVSGAVSSIKPGEVTIIQVGHGIYYERVHIPVGMNEVSIIGSGTTSTLIVHDTAGSVVGTFSSWTVLVEADDFFAENIAFANNASNYDHTKAGQSVALDLRGDRGTILNCHLLGAQDTLYTGTKRNYFYGNYINGSVDSIFGEGASVFEQCTIEITSYVTAHKGEANSATKYLLTNSTIRGPSNRPYVPHSTYLGRPWGCYAWVIYKECYIGDLIDPTGWWDWGKNSSCLATVNYDEYGNTGPGAGTSKRVPWSHLLTKAEADKYTPETVLSGWVPALAQQSVV